MRSPRSGSNEALDRLVAAYPDVLARHDDEHLYWRDGTVMAVSDGIKDKSFEQRLKNASILDQMALPYHVGHPSAPPAVNDDPGRFRNEAFFRKLYGDCRKGEVDRQMVPLSWLPKTYGKTVRVTKAQGVADHLKAVSIEVDKVAAGDQPGGLSNPRGAVLPSGRRYRQDEHARLRRRDRPQRRFF